MGLPPVDVLFDPVGCMPAWISRFASLPSTIVRSGCSTVGGNVQCDPAAMARAAGVAVGVSVSLEAYTLARYMTSEVGGGPVAERAAVGQDAINRVRYVEPKLGNVNNLLLYRQPVGSPNRGFYGPIHGTTTGGLTAPFGRWAATSSDPSVANVMLAVALLNGEIPEGWNKGADDQNGPRVFISVYGLPYAIANVQSRGAARKYWVGSLPGVNPLRTMQYRTLASVDPVSALGKQLIARGVAAVSSAAPNWSGLPVCVAGAESALTKLDLGGGSWLIGAAALVTAAVVGALLWRRRMS